MRLNVLRGRLKSREGSRESALGRLARRTRGSIPAAGCDRACNAARRPKALSPVGLPRFWRRPALLAWPRSLRISALRSRLAQRQNRRNATPSYFLDTLLEACVFETVGPRVSQIAIPAWVFKDLDQTVEERNFRYDDMIYPAGQRRPMGRAQVPDESRMETQLWFYYQAASYIDVGCEGIHFGQVEIMNRNDHGNTNWFRLISRVRDYAARHARCHLVLCNGHVPGGGLMHEGNPIL